MHLVAARGAAKMRETGPAYETPRRLGMIDRHQQTPRRRAGVNRIVVECRCTRAPFYQHRQRRAGCDRALRERQHRVNALEQAKRRLLNASDAPCPTVHQLNEAGGRRAHLHLMLQPRLGALLRRNRAAGDQCVERRAQVAPCYRNLAVRAGCRRAGRGRRAFPVAS